MEQPINIQKALAQHAALNDYFADFIPRGKTREIPRPPIAEPSPQAETIAPTPIDLSGLHQQILACQKCNLHQSRTHAVPGEGSPQAQIMLVGEAPGEDEDRMGRPFVGRAGQLLDKILSACGLNREEVFIGNILKCRPPQQPRSPGTGNPPMPALPPSTDHLDPAPDYHCSGSPCRSYTAAVVTIPSDVYGAASISYQIVIQPSRSCRPITQPTFCETTPQRHVDGFGKT